MSQGEGVSLAGYNQLSLDVYHFEMWSWSFSVGSDELTDLVRVADHHWFEEPQVSTFLSPHVHVACCRCACNCVGFEHELLINL